MFLPVEKRSMQFSEIQGQDIEYVKIGDVEDDIYVIGEDQYRLSNVFNKEVRRTMKRGIIQQDEIDQADIMTMMLSKVAGKTKGGKCIYSIPSEPIDEPDTAPVLYHEQVISRMFKTLGYKQESLNESMQIIFAECKKDGYSGIQISFGSGLTNVCCQYKGTPTLQFSIYRGGDWIDHNQQKSIGLLQSRVTYVKENSFSLLDLKSKNKQEHRIKEQLGFFYRSLIEYTLEKIVDKFNEDSENLSIDAKIPIVVSGGTSKPDGFLDVFKDTFEDFHNFPYEVSEIRQQTDPMNQVQEGCMLYAEWKNSKEL